MNEKSEFEEKLQKIERVLAEFLPENPDRRWIFKNFGEIDECVNSAHFQNLLEPTRNLVNLGGKRWRPLLFVLCAESLGGSEAESRAEKLVPLVEFAHTASLIHDDIEDNSTERRGKPAAHILFGEDCAINAGSWLYFQATSCIMQSTLKDREKLDCFALFCEELRRLHLGQAMDILWHKTPDLFPTIDEYTAMVRNKTGTLARLAVRLGVLCGGADANFQAKAGKIAEDFGTGFQIIDDVQNLSEGNPGKKRGDDIVEGKKSLPVLIHLQKNPDDKEKLCELFKQAKVQGIESSAVEEAISILTKSGAISIAKEKGNALIDKKSAELCSILGKSRASDLVGILFSSLKK